MKEKLWGRWRKHSEILQCGSCSVRNHLISYSGSLPDQLIFKLEKYKKWKWITWWMYFSFENHERALLALCFLHSMAPGWNHKHSYQEMGFTDIPKSVHSLCPGQTMLQAAGIPPHQLPLCLCWKQAIRDIRKNSPKDWSGAGMAQGGDGLAIPWRSSRRV